jgi:hypothetical protein
MKNKNELSDFEKEFNAKMNSQLIGAFLMFLAMLGIIIVYEMHLEGKL